MTPLTYSFFIHEIMLAYYVSKTLLDIVITMMIKPYMVFLFIELTV